MVYLAVSTLGGLVFLPWPVRLFRSRAGDQPDKAEAVAARGRIV